MILFAFVCLSNLGVVLRALYTQVVNTVLAYIATGHAGLEVGTLVLTAVYFVLSCTSPGLVHIVIFLELVVRVHARSNLFRCVGGVCSIGFVNAWNGDSFLNLGL